LKLETIETVVRALNNANIRYIIAGGLAVNAHGYLRFTADIDLVIALDQVNIIQAFKVLAEIGYTPQVPVTANQFADQKLRQQWISEKGMQVLNFWSETHKETTLDIFVSEPFEFDDEYNHCMEGELLPGLTTRFVSIPTLIKMKEVANRARDIDDIQHLRWIIEEQKKNDE
jgi:hypothetical protein